MILALGCLSVFINFVAFCIAAVLQTEKFYDLTGSLTYLVLTLVSFIEGEKNPRQAINSLLVILWAVRLGQLVIFQKYALTTRRVVFIL
jgi:steroid 5-alpha reductase family enzyme